MLRGVLATIVSCALLVAQDTDWQKDLDVLIEEFPKRHKSPFTVVAEADWRKEAAELRAQLAAMDDDHALVAIRRLVARIGDSHSMVHTNQLSQGALPLRAVWWPDGVRVFATSKEHERAIGCRITQVCGKPIDDVLAALAVLEVCDNEGMRRTRLPLLLAQPRVLYGLGLGDRRDRVTLQVAPDEGQPFDVELVAAERPPAFVFPKRAAQAVTDQRGASWHHLQWLPDDGILYLQYNRCATSKEHDLSRFTQQAAEILQKEKVTAIVFDLQYNGGGNSSLGDMMFAALAMFEPLKSRQNVFCLIGAPTFSSGILNALRLKDSYGATLIGAETSGSPNCFGEVKSFELPHHQLVVQYSTKRFAHGDGTAKTIAPDVPIARSYADWLAGKDPLLEAVRARSK